MKFTLEIELGNAAMQSPDDVAESLRQVSDLLKHNERFGTTTDTARIFDDNGNTVGEWAFRGSMS